MVGAGKTAARSSANAQRAMCAAAHTLLFARCLGVLCVASCVSASYSRNERGIHRDLGQHCGSWMLSDPVSSLTVSGHIDIDNWSRPAQQRPVDVSAAIVIRNARHW